ncbi:MAG TPA: menaquinone reductase multiheme cytochrome c subunit QrcA [Bryobacteraceae bacterium]|nr:menaquinone reductase multiheme cytochrome c subunit QrcA [Bryobacteraceae bacterium]
MSLRTFAGFAAGVAAALFTGWQAFPHFLYATQRQPLVFSHKTHMEKAGGTCDDCHFANGAFSGIPRVEKCAGCHAAAMTQSADEKILIDRYIAHNREVPWLVYARQPDNVYFPHAIHTRLAKLACERCHGAHGSSSTLRPFERNRISGYSRDIWGDSISRVSFRPLTRPGMKMDDCAQCHRDCGVSTSCVACHR